MAKDISGAQEKSEVEKLGSANKALSLSLSFFL